MNKATAGQSTGIGISLEDLGIETRSTGKRSTPKIDEYPKAYDFSVALALYGSWSKLRDGMLKRLKEKGTDLGMWIPIFWTKVEEETEESIKALLTGMVYDKTIHMSLKDNLEAWVGSQTDPEIIRQAVAAIEGSEHDFLLVAVAKNKHTPQSLLEEFVKDSRFSYALLENPGLTTQMIRDIYAMVKNDAAGPQALAGSVAELPADIIEALSGQMALEALKGFSQHLQDYTEEPATEYKDFDFDWTDRTWEVFNVVVEVRKEHGTVVCEASVFDDSGQEFSRISYEALQDEEARAIIAGYVLALQEGR
jgi:hypothetical protein